MMHLTRITSETRLSKHYRLALNGELVKIPGGTMRSGSAEVLAIQDLLKLKEIICTLSTQQALTFGIPKGVRAGQSVALTTKAGLRFHHGSIARSREHFAFPSGEGILLLDYDPVAGSQPIGPRGLQEILLPILGQVEMLISASASSWLYRENGGAIKEGGGLHVFVRVAKADDIPAIGAAIDAHCWLRGFGRLVISKGGARLLRGLFDTSVWQPERLSFDAGADCAEGLVQKRPEPSHWSGGALTLADVALSPEELARVERLKATARGVRILAPLRRAPAPRRITPPTSHGGSVPQKLRQALLHISPDCDYQTWVSVGMALHHAGFVDGYDVWDGWSSHGAGYPGALVTRYKWESFGEFGGQKVGIGTLYCIAAQWGWSKETFDRPQLAVRPLSSRAAATPETGQPLDVSEARRQLRTALWSIFGQVKKRKKEKEEARSKEMRIPLWAVEATTGLSKSSIIRELIPFLRAEGIKTVIVARNKVDAEQYAAAGALFRRGRANLDAEAQRMGLADGWALGLPYHCPHADREVASLANGEHTISQMCRGGHCEHGNELMAQQSVAENRAPSPGVLRYLARRSESAFVPACTWLPHHKEGQEAVVTVVVAGGLGSGDLESAELVIVDEVTDLIHTRSIGMDEIRAAITRLHKALERLQNKSLSPLEDDEDEAATPKRLETLKKALAMYEAVPALLAQAAIDAPDGAYRTAEGIRVLVDAAGAFRNRTQEWETPEWEYLELVGVPLRFAHELFWAAKTGSIAVKDARLEILYQHPVVAECAGKIPLLLLDATLSPEALALTETDGEEVTRIVAAQNLHIQCDPRQFRGQMDESDAAFNDRIHREISDVQATLRRMAKVKSGFYPVIARKQLALRLLAEALGTDLTDLGKMDRKTLWDVSIRAGIGWFGWHDRAHDEWKHADGLLVWGQPVIPADAWAARWEGYRALRIQLGLDDASGLPHWDNEWVAQQWVAVGSEYEQQSRCRLPGNQTVREWMLGELARVRVQAVGRLRGANRAERCLVWFVGGAPLAGLERYGLTIASYDRLVPGRSYYERRQATHAARHEAALVAATQLALQGQSLTRAAIQKEMRRTPAVCPSTVRDTSNGGTNTSDVSMTARCDAIRNDSYSDLLAAHPWLAPYLADSGRNARVVRATRQLLATRGKEIANNLLFKLRVLLFSVGWQWDHLAGFAQEVLESTQSDYHEAARWIIDAGLAPPS
ncbi:PriCT-2 domain-containing protein [Acidithiobacillus caldus]|jgi:hypothetical protein